VGRKLAALAALAVAWQWRQTALADMLLQNMISLGNLRLDNTSS